MASSAESMRLRCPEPMPWTLSAVPMTTALDRVKQATVQLNSAARTSSGLGVLAETTSTDSAETIFESNRFWTRRPPATLFTSSPLSTEGASRGAPILTTRRTFLVARTPSASGAKSGA